MDILDRKTATALGLVRYFPDKPCRNGHVGERYTRNGLCVICRKLSDERNPTSAAVRAAIEKRHYEKHGDKRRAHRREKYQEERQRPGLLAAAVDRNREWARANPTKRAAQCAVRRARKLGAEGHYTAEDVARIREAQRDRCAYCPARLNGAGDVDHITPLAKGGTNWPRNLQLLCHPCNSSKSARDPIDHARSTGRLL